jgi:ATP-dependent Lhr-like helicase
LADGALLAYLRRGNPNLQVFLPEEEPQRGQLARALAEFFVRQAQLNPEGVGGILIVSVNGLAVAEHWMARALLDAGFHAAPMGFNVRRNLPMLPRAGGEAVVANA